ncbi:MAG: alpha/beta hydrolase [Bacteroidetes bacterium]|nr:alpha/beta hydrolase [Bacteroidota bacterium]
MQANYNNIHYSKVGTGPHLCFLHGFCEDSRIWQPVVDELKDTFTCTTINLPGFGASKGIRFTSIPQVASQIHELLQAENITNPILFGHSLGGYILAEYMHQYDHCLRAAGFIHSSTYCDTPSKKENRSKTASFIRSHGTKEFFRLFVSSLVAIQHRSVLRESLYAMVTSTPTQSVIDGLLAMQQREDRSEVLTSFDKPILMLHGAEDDYYAPDVVCRQAALCQAVQLDILPNIGHLSMLEDQKKYLTKVRHFIRFVEGIETPLT